MIGKKLPTLPVVTQLRSSTPTLSISASPIRATSAQASKNLRYDSAHSPHPSSLPRSIPPPPPPLPPHTSGPPPAPADRAVNAIAPASDKETSRVTIPLSSRARALRNEHLEQLVRAEHHRREHARDQRARDQHGDRAGEGWEEAVAAPGRPVA